MALRAVLATVTTVPELAPVDRSRLRGLIAAIALSVALLLYGAWSAPAPPSVRPTETAIGLLLVVAVGWWRPLQVLTGHGLRAGKLAGWEALAIPAFGWLLWVPLLRGAAIGWGPAEIARDVIPLLYLFLPLLVVPALRLAGSWGLVLPVAGLSLAGLLFVLRWWNQAGWGFGAVGVRAMEDGGAYFLNAPSVLFAAVLLPTLALSVWVYGGIAGRLAAPGLAAAGALCVAALAGAVHRGALGLATLAGAAAAVWWWRRAPVAVATGLMAVAVALGVYGDPLWGALGQAAEKTRLTGANTRWEEASAVLAHIARSPWSLLFGDGWGAVIANPAVGGWRVSYTHTLASYILVKGGILGAVALAAYLGGLLRLVAGAMATAPPLAWSVVPPLAMALGFHTSFKYLDTGLLLCVLVLGCEMHRATSPG